MRLNGKTDVDVPIEFVMRVLSDYAGWERAALRRGLEVARLDSRPQPGLGSRWAIKFPLRGKLRQVEVQVAELDNAGRQVLTFRGASAEGTGSVMALAMSARRTRLNVTVDIAARTLAARLFLHSIRLARLRVKRRFDARLDKLGQEIVQRYRDSGQR